VLESLTAGTLDIRAEICDFDSCQTMIHLVVAEPPRSQGSMRKSSQSLPRGPAWALMCRH